MRSFLVRHVRPRFALWVVLALPIAAAGCGGGGGSSTDPNGGGNQETGTVFVRVEDVAGDPVAGAGVQLQRTGEPTRTATTSGSGEVTFTSVRVGTWQLVVQAPSGFQLPADTDIPRSVSVTAGATASETVELEEAAVEPDVVEITLTGQFRFSPESVTIEPGTTVRWINGVDVDHTITPDGHSEWERQVMSTQGQTFEHRFDDAGSFDYFCEPHLADGMTGHIRVES